MNAARYWLEHAGALVWSGPTVVLFLVTGAYLTFVLRGVQLRRLGAALRRGLLVRDEAAEGDISHFQALMLALGGSLGAGSLMGVAAALAAGGPGALLWLWLVGWLAMATRYAEAALGVYYREPDREGRMAGGPMYYLSRGLGGWAGRVLAGTFAALAALAALSMGSAVPGHAATETLRLSLSVPPLLTAGVLAALVGGLAVGGIGAIGRVVGVLVPVAVAACLVGGLAVLAVNADRLGAVLGQVLQGALGPGAAAGGVLGASVREAVRWGAAQGLVTAGSGLGTGGIAAAAARTHTPSAQAEVAMLQTFIDTILVSAVVGLALLATGAHEALAAGGPATVTGAAWSWSPAGMPTALPPDFGGAIVAMGVAFFAFFTILAWSYYGERAAEYLFGRGATTPFRLLFVAAVLAGGAALGPGPDGVALLRSAGGVLTGAMAIPNLIGLLLLSGVVAREARRPSPD